MSEAQIRRTYPCGHQESITIKGWGVALAASIKEANEPQPCPIHSTNCHRGA